MIRQNSKVTSKKRLLLISGGVILLALVVLFVLEKSHIINLYTKDNPVATTDDTKTTSTAPTAQEDFTGGDERPITRNVKDEGIIQDTGGSVTSVPPESQWSKSNDSKVTVYTPTKDVVLKSSDTLSGESTLSQVSFRLIDDVSGVIAQGSLAVVNGKFSGTFSFSTSGTNGRLDVFHAANDGVESSIVEIPVRFK